MTRDANARNSTGLDTRPSHGSGQLSASAPRRQTPGRRRQGSWSCSTRGRWKLMVPSLLIAAGFALWTPAAADLQSATTLPAHTPCSDLPCWSWPLPAPRTVAGPFRAPPHPYGPGHRGIDITAAEGAEVLAVDDGTVSFAGRVVDRPVVTVAHDHSWRSSHEPVEPVVAQGDRVVRGQVIGRIAAGSHCSGCLHLGARHLDDYFSPLLLIEGADPSVLLPLP
ncbi:M23 family metallopeptidase [Pseudoclavibacter sp. 13-3]|uniref:M23 family metallopeptidase n=1 Tax=Pseudoclavibacter sp. 13-3 TaxID=2901228 RepID=UPI001E4EE93C|nr:peptidoglycan DD-metalloendopeptidase family protein [Pseudoclavibacter sp. 13-3]MCD7100881.1 peptidoglycan DD-metalloendopeptidase family protein [Pseudoclavibacter sp. 13-3]